MIELVAALVTTIDVLIIYTVLQLQRGRLTIALWTALLNMALPLIGFMMGEFTAQLFSEWSNLLSGVLLALIGVHVLLHDGEEQSMIDRMSPFLLALLVSLDTFSVSVTFGMLQLNKWLFIFASGILSFGMSIVALLSTGRIPAINGKVVRRITGLVFIGLGVMSCIS